MCLKMYSGKGDFPHLMKYVLFFYSEAQSSGSFTVYRVIFFEITNVSAIDQHGSTLRCAMGQ